MKTRYINVALLASLTLLFTACSTTQPSHDSYQLADLTHLVGSNKSQDELDLTEVKASLKAPTIERTQVIRTVDLGTIGNNVDEPAYNATYENSIAANFTSTSGNDRFSPQSYEHFELPKAGTSQSNVLKYYGEPAKRQQGSNNVNAWDYGTFRVIIQNNVVSHASMW